MSLPRYREYLPTGNPLIPKLPADWSVSPLRTLGKFLKGRGGSKQDASESGVPCIRYGELYTTFSCSIRSPRGFVPAEVANAYAPISKGDVLFAASGEDMADIGRSAVNLLEGPTVCGGDLVILRPTVDVLPEFLGFACDSTIAKAQKSMMGRGTTVKHIYPDELRQVVIALPPRREQEGIARFLEKETAKIDALIAEQERLIALLQEKRQAVITHAVTKGLGSNAPMKDSGVEWIGEVPKHWQVLPGRRIAAPFSTESVAEDSLIDSGEVMYLKVSSLVDDAMYVRDSEWYAGAESGIHDAPSMFIVFPKRGAAISLNRVNIVRSPALLDPNLMGWMPTPGFDIAYLAYTLKARKLVSLADVSTIPQLNNKHIDPALFPIPPLDEQRAIVAYLESTLAGLDALCKESDTMRACLSERRTALITAAVTGQIDVRGLVETAA